MAAVHWQVQSPEAMVALGEVFGRLAQGGEVFLLVGELGAGKTQWVKGLGKGLGVRAIINSPTFTIVKPYVGRLELQHVDLYRLNTEREVEELGLEELQDPRTVIAVEWADRHPALEIWENAARIDFGFMECQEDRVVKLDLTSSQVKQRAASLPGVNVL